MKEEIIQLLKDGNESFSPLFLLPPISEESTYTYRKLCDSLKTLRKVFAINPLLARSSIPLTAQLILQQSRGPLNLIGFSSAGIVAYEIASYLEEKDEVIGFLGIIDEIAPHLLNFLNYKPKKLSKTAIIIFRTEATHNKVLRMTNIPNETFSLGWSKYTLCFGVCELQGDHFSIMQSPQVLATKLDLCVRSSISNNKSKEKLEILKDLSQKVDKLLYLLDKFKIPPDSVGYEEKIPRKIKKSIVSSSMIWGKSESDPEKTGKLSSHSNVLIRAKL